MTDDDQSELTRPEPSREPSRRTFLRGAGVTMALPWLESLPVWGARRRPARRPRPSGSPPCSWATASTRRTGGRRAPARTMELGKSLEPLAPLQGQDQRHQRPVQQARHRRRHPPRADRQHPLRRGRSRRGPSCKAGISIDQVLASHLGEETVQPSLVLGCEQPITGYHETNFSMAYSSHISWQSATSPVPMEVYPSLAFDSLFDNRGSQRNLSILDRVREQAAALSRQVSAADQAQARRVPDQRPRGREARRAACARDKDKADGPRRATAASRSSTMTRPDNGLPEDIREHMRLMCDIIALGFQTDKTRVATLLLCRDISGLFYPFLDVRAAHHPASHDDRPTPTSGSRGSTSASSPTSPASSTRCRKARARCSTTPA